jgi:hypothetical protein
MNYGIKLTIELESTILAAIRQGGFIQDAFRLAGVPDKVWTAWLDTKHTRGQFYTLQNKIRQAQAVARFTASQQVKKDDPFKWCANGPGRDAPGDPGWAAMVTLAPTTDPKNLDPMLFPEFIRFVNNVRIVMAAFPEARLMLDQLQAAPTPQPLENNPEK